MAALSVTETVSWGILYYGFPVFLRSMEGHLEASRVAVTGGFSVGMGVAALAALPVGRWIHRRGPRGLMTFGSCLGTALLLLWSRVESLPAFYVLWAIMGVALATTLYEPAFAAVVAWFTARHRDRALTIVTLAGALASTIFMPIAAWLLEHLGWRAALLVLAAILGVTTIPLHALVLRPRDSSGADERYEGRSSVPSASFRQALATPFFWILTVAFVAGNFATVSVTVHLIPYLTDRGWSAPVAAAAIGWIGAMQIAGRVVFGAIAARLGARAITATMFVAQAVGLSMLAVVRELPGGLLPIVIVLGIANGMSTLARATTLASVFGPREYATISGALAAGANGARAVGPVGASLLYVALGGYEAVFWTLAAALALAGLAVAVTEARAPAGGTPER